MHPTLLFLHSAVRWLVLATLLLALVRAWRGWGTGLPWLPADDNAGRWLSISMDTQVLLGILLYIVSPLAKTGRADFAAAMADGTLRFWTVEHAVMMIIAAALVHVGRSRAAKAATDLERHRRSALFFTVALLVIAFAIPWPFSDPGRPWLTVP